MKSVFYYPNGYKSNGENHVTPFLTLLLKTSDDFQKWWRRREKFYDGHLSN
jgi:hypothetical protein